MIVSLILYIIMTLLAHKLRFYGSCKKIFKYFRKSARGSAVSNNGGPSGWSSKLTARACFFKLGLVICIFMKITSSSFHQATT